MRSIKFSISKERLQDIWQDRKDVLENKVKIRIFDYFFLNSAISFVLIGGASFFLEQSFPKTLVGILLGVYFLIAVIVSNVSNSEDMDRKAKVIILMIWDNLFYLVLGLSILYVGTSIALSFEFIPSTQSWILILFLSPLFFSLWLITFILVRIGNKFSSWLIGDSTPAIGFIGLFAIFLALIRLARSLIQNLSLEGKAVYLLIVSVFVCIIVFLKFFYQLNHDYLLTKQKYIE